jgi:hypothetical protein
MASRMKLGVGDPRNRIQKAGAAILSVLVAWVLIGCARSNVFLSRNSYDPRNVEQMLQVVHVVSEAHLLAGFPRTCQEYLTAASELQPLLAGVVDGFPMVAKGDPSRTSVTRPGINAPCVILTGRGYAATPNVIDPSLNVAAGELVLLGGFLRPGAGMTAVEYLDVPPSVISGRVLEPETGAEPPGRYRVLVPDGEYGGFIGGPAARRDADGSLRVWGVTVGWERILHGSLPACRLEVARLEGPADGTTSSPSTGR